MFAEFEPRLAFHLNRLTRKTPPRVVFLHIPKCGGTSVNHHFKSNFGGSRTRRSVLLDSVIGNASRPDVLEQAKKAQYVAGHFGWATLQLVSAGAFTFTIVREPFERLLALYQFARKPRRIAHPAFAKLNDAAGSMEFGAFCLHDDPEIRAMTDNVITRTLASDYFPFGAAPDVDAARRHLDQLDFVTDVARLSTALPRIADATQTKIVRGRDWLNRTRAADGAMSRKDFLADSALRARISHDLEVYEHAQGRII